MKRQPKKSAVETISGRRSCVRAPHSSPVNIGLGPKETHGRVLDVAEGGAFVATDSAPKVLRDDGVRLRFRLSGSVELSVFGRVRWVREIGTSREPPGFGVEFVGLGKAETQAIAEFVKQRETDEASAAVISRVIQKYTVQIASNAVWIRLIGHLDAEESQELCSIVAEKIEQLKGESLLAFIDATRFSACPEESLPFLKECLAQLGSRNPSFAVMIGSGSVAMLQMRRLAREAGVADTIACFENEDEAQPFWQQIQQEVQESYS